MKNGKKKKRSFTEGILGLISEPEFAKIENLLSEPNIFRIVGRSHYERWHSSFLAWLLDSNGTHLLRDYVLTRLLYLLLDEKCLKADNHNKIDIFKILPTIDFDCIEVTPNEYVPTETSIKGVGRFDVLLKAKYTDDLNNSNNINILIELKIDSKTRSNQSKKYADWLEREHPGDINLLIYILPELLSNSKSTVGDKRWYCMNYQLLNDKLLNPILDHPNLNDKVKTFIIQYIKNLSCRYKGVKMAITKEEKKLATRLYKKYRDEFDTIYDALQAEGIIDFGTSDLETDKGRTSGRLAVKIDNKIFDNETVRELFEDILVYLVDKDHVKKLQLPWGKSTKRFIVTDVEPPIHPTGREFFYPVKYKGYALESHYSRDRALKILDNICRELKIDFESIEV